MARVIRGRSPYRQGTDAYEAFRPEEREYRRTKPRSTQDELLRIMALAERIGSSPLGGAALEGLKAIKGLFEEGEEAPTLQQAAEARAKAAGAAIPTPEEQGRKAGEAQADEFIQKALQTPAAAIAPLAPAKVIAEAGPARLSVRKGPTPEQEDLAKKAQEELARKKAQEELLQRREALTSELETKRELLARMEQVSPEYKIRMRALIKGGTEAVSAALENIRTEVAKNPAGVSAQKEQFYDVMSDYLRIMKGQEVPDIMAGVGEAARAEEERRRVVRTGPEQQTQYQRENQQVADLRRKADELEQNLTENISQPSATGGFAMSDEAVAKRFDEIEQLRQQADVLELRLAQQRTPSEMDTMASQEPEVALQMAELEPKAPTLTLDELRRQRASEGAKSREAATRVLGGERIPPAEEGVTGEMPRRPEGMSLQNIKNIVDQVIGIRTKAEQPVDEMSALAMAKGVPEQMEKLGISPEQLAQEEETQAQEETFMERARAGEKSLQTQREEAERDAYAQTVMKVAGPTARPEQAKTFVELLARARTASDPQEQAELIRQTENVSLPAQSLFDAMFGGPQQRARAELIKYFPAPQKKTPRTLTQELADLALAEQRLASAARTRGLEEEYDPARVKKLQADTARAREEAEAEYKGFSKTTSLIYSRLQPKGKGGRGRGPTPIQQVEGARRAAIEEANKAEASALKKLDGSISKAQGVIDAIDKQPKGTIADPGPPPEPPKRSALGSEKKAYADRMKAWSANKAKYDQDQEKGRQLETTRQEADRSLAELLVTRQNITKQANEDRKIINDEAARLTGGKPAQLRQAIQQGK